MPQRPTGPHPTANQQSRPLSHWPIGGCGRSSMCSSAPKPTAIDSNPNQRDPTSKSQPVGAPQLQKPDPLSTGRVQHQDRRGHDHHNHCCCDHEHGRRHLQPESDGNDEDLCGSDERELYRIVEELLRDPEPATSKTTKPGA